MLLLTKEKYAVVDDVPCAIQKKECKKYPRLTAALALGQDDLAPNTLAKEIL